MNLKPDSWTPEPRSHEHGKQDTNGANMLVMVDEAATMTGSNNSTLGIGGGVDG